MAIILVNALSALTGVPLDQVLFFVAQIFAIISGYILKTYLPPRKDSVIARHILESVLGLSVLYICYQRNVSILLLQALSSYMIIFLLPSRIANYIVLILSLLLLSYAHLKRLASFDGQHETMDITAPLMIQTQKLTSLVFNIWDGELIQAGKEPSRISHRQHAVRRRPSLFQFLGYLHCFQNVLVGPFIFYSDYLCYIEGREEDLFTDPKERELVIQNKEKIRNAKGALKTQAFACVVHVLLTCYATSRFIPGYLVSDEFQRLGICHKYFWLSLYCFYFRQPFYFAWATSALAMLISGFGFSGFSPSGTLEPEYRNAINIRFFNVELGTNTKVMLDNWNIGTSRWLRECVYDRTPRKASLIAVFFASAFWHGFYPVYYLTFFSGALLTMTGRMCRSRLRPCFIDSYWHHRLYDIITNMAAIFAFNYSAIGFVLLDTSLTLKLWANFYYLGHIVPLLMMFLLPYALPNSIREPKKDVADVTYELSLDPTLGTAITRSSPSSPFHEKLAQN